MQNELILTKDCIDTFIKRIRIAAQRSVCGDYDFSEELICMADMYTAEMLARYWEEHHKFIDELNIRGGSNENI